MKGAGTGNPQQIQDAAQRGTEGPASELPHAATIQRAFGAHDISGIRAHVGPAAKNATGAMAAEAYATGNDVAFAKQPDLHTAAHEAAHVVQQKKGVNLSGGVGAEGDSHEKHADAVADQVVAGKSVEHMLGPATKNAAPAAGQAVQRKPAEKAAADPRAAEDKSEQKSFSSAQSGLKYLAKELHTWRPELSSLTNANTNSEAGAEPAAQAIEAIFHRANALISDVHDMILVAAKSERNLLAPEVKLVQGAWDRFRIPAQVAGAFLKNHGHDDPKLGALQQMVDSLTDQIGLEGTQLTPDTTVPEGDEKALSKEMISDQVTGLGAAIDSVKAGNEADASRIIMHTRYLENVSKEHVAEIKTHRSQLKAFLKEIGELRHASPALDNRLSEATGDLMRLLQ
jgi:hypothetical protein